MTTSGSGSGSSASREMAVRKLGLFEEGDRGRPPAQLDEQTLVNAWIELRALQDKKERQRAEMKRRWMPVLRWLQDTSQWDEMTDLTIALAKIYEGEELDARQLSGLVEIEDRYYYYVMTEMNEKRDKKGADR